MAVLSYCRLLNSIEVGHASAGSMRRSYPSQTRISRPGGVRGLLDYASLHALLQPCAVLAILLLSL